MAYAGSDPVDRLRRKRDQATFRQDLGRFANGALVAGLRIDSHNLRTHQQ